jgi:DNA polymerase-3 subunit beta
MNALARNYESAAPITGEVIRFPGTPVVPAGPGTALVDRKALGRAVDIATAVVEKRNSAAILGNLKLIGNGSTLFVTGTDCDIEIAVSVAAAADIHFGVTVPAHTLKDLVKKAPDCEFVGFTAAEVATKNKEKWEYNAETRKNELVTLDETYEECTTPAVIDFEKVNYKLKALPVSDFPIIKMRSAHSFMLRGAVLLDALNAVSIAISTEETRYYLNGIYFHALDDALCMVATDGHRLCKQEFGLADGCEDMPGIIIPRKTVMLLEKLWKGKNCPESVKVDVSETRIRFTFGDVTITSKVIDGTFPDYGRVIPQHNDKLTTFNTAGMIEAVKAVTVITSERGRAVKFEFGADSVHLSCNNPDSGSAHSDFDCEYASDEMEIGLNYRYLIDMLNTAGSEAVTFAMADAGSPILITGEREGWTGVMMPMRV